MDIAGSKKDMEVRIGFAWKALNKLKKIWKSKLKREIKIIIFDWANSLMTEIKLRSSIFIIYLFIYLFMNFYPG